MKRKYSATIQITIAAMMILTFLYMSNVFDPIENFANIIFLVLLIYMLLIIFIIKHQKKKDINKFFKAVKLEIDGNYPKVKDKSIDEAGDNITYIIEMPVGLSSDDFVKRKLSLEQYMNKDITINFNNALGNLVIKEEPRKKKNN